MRSSIGNSVPGLARPKARFRSLGQDISEFGDPEQLLGLAAEWIDKIPIDDPAYDKFRDRLSGCLDKLSSFLGIFSAGKCGYDLYRDVKAYREALDEAEAKPQPKPTTQPQPQPQADVPWVPILLAAGAGVAAVVLLS